MTHTITIHDERRATINCRASAQAMQVARGLEGHRSWLKGGGLRFEPSQRNIELLCSALGAEVQHSVTEEFRTATSFGRYTPKTEPMQHQLRALQHIAPKRHTALFMEQGTGKTWVALTRAGQLWAEGAITGLLIVSKKGVHRQWVDQQMPEHYGAPFTASAWPKGPSPTYGDGLDAFAINIEAFAQERSKGRQAVMGFVERHAGRVLMVVDESHQIKNATTKRWRACSAVGNLCDHRMALTGTPIAANLEDEWAQLKWLDEKIIGIRYIGSFRNEYCIMGGFEGKHVIGSKNVDRFKALTEPHCFRVTKEEIGLMPKLYSKWHFDLTASQLQAIKGIKEDLRLEIQEAESSGREVPMSTAASATMAMQQISNGFLYDNTGGGPRVHNLFAQASDNPRCQALGQILDEIQGPTIVWARFQQDIHEITRYLVEQDWAHGFVTYYGETRPKEREQAVSDFLGGRCRLFIANPSAAGTGLNLQSGGCQNAIYYSNSDNSIERWQSEDRIHRIGMKGGAQYWDLVAERSIDKAILRRLSSKKSFSQMVLGDILKELADE